MASQIQWLTLAVVAFAWHENRPGLPKVLLAWMSLIASILIGFGVHV